MLLKLHGTYKKSTSITQILKKILFDHAMYHSTFFGSYRSTVDICWTSMSASKYAIFCALLNFTLAKVVKKSKFLPSFTICSGRIKILHRKLFSNCSDDNSDGRCDHTGTSDKHRLTCKSSTMLTQRDAKSAIHM